MVYKFVDHFGSLIEGSQSTALLKAFRHASVQLKRNLNETMPNCRPFTCAEEDNHFPLAIPGEDPQIGVGRPIYIPEVSDFIDKWVSNSS